MGGLKNSLIVKRDIGSTGFPHLSDERGLSGAARSHDQNDRSIRKGYFCSLLHKTLEHPTSESRPVGIIGFG